MIYFLFAVMGIWLLIGIALWYATTPAPKGSALMQSVQRAAIYMVVLFGYIALFLAAGFAVHVFSTNPPPPIPGCEGKVDGARYIVFGVIAFLIGASCNKSLRGLQRSLKVDGNVL